MINVITVFPRLDDAKTIRNILVKSGYQVTAVCATGAQAISQIDEFGYGIVVCGYKMPDMLYSQLKEYLPGGYEILLLASRNVLEDQGIGDVMCLSKPLKVHELISTMDMMSESLRRRKRKQKLVPKKRDDRERQKINEAKNLLMSRNNMTEEEAHRYIQKCSMDSGTNMVETAEMILSMIR